MTSGCQAVGNREVRLHAMSLAVGQGKLFHMVYFVFCGELELTMQNKRSSIENPGILIQV